MLLTPKPFTMVGEPVAQTIGCEGKPDVAERHQQHTRIDQSLEAVASGRLHAGILSCETIFQPSLFIGREELRIRGSVSQIK